MSSNNYPDQLGEAAAELRAKGMDAIAKLCEDAAEELADAHYARNWLWRYTSPHDMAYPEFLERMAVMRMKEEEEEECQTT